MDPRSLTIGAKILMLQFFVIFIRAISTCHGQVTGKDTLRLLVASLDGLDGSITKQKSGTLIQRRAKEKGKDSAASASYRYYCT